MISELKKSINSILYERVSSPLFGTFTLTWLLWNWKAIYITLFVDEKKLVENKLDYISSNFTDLNHVIYYPIISTVILLTVIPFVSNGAFWLKLKFDKWKHDKKHEIEKSQLLTLEQSIQIRNELDEKEKTFRELLENKDLEINQLKIEIEELKNKPEEKIIDNTSPAKNSSDELNGEHIEILHTIAKGGGLMKDDDIVKSSSFDKVKTEYYLEDLENKGYLSRDYRQDVEAYVTGLTTKGKEIMVTKNFVK